MMHNKRLEAVEVIKVDPSYNAVQFQEFINKWNADNPEKAENDAFMPLFSPFIDSCSLIVSDNVKEKNDLLSLTMLVTPEQWPTKQEVADISFFVHSLTHNYDFLSVKMIFEVVWK